MYSQLAHDLALQASLLDQAQKHRLIELDDVIEKTVEQVVKAYRTHSYSPSLMANESIYSTHIPVSKPMHFMPSVPSSVTMDYVDLDIVLMPGLDGRQLKWLVKQIVREVYEALWDENE